MKKLGFCEQVERNPEHPYIGIGGKENVCEISAKNIQLYGSWS